MEKDKQNLVVINNKVYSYDRFSNLYTFVSDANVTRELRVYGIDVDLIEGNIENITNEDWIELSEQSGFIWSLNGFSNQFNASEIPFDNILIRII